MSFTEEPLRSEVANGFFPQVGARYVCRGERRPVRDLLPYGLRYLNVLTTSRLTSPVRPRHPDVSVHEQLSPSGGEASFSCSDRC